MGNDENLIKEIRDRCTKQDRTLKIKLKPGKFFIGNYQMKLDDDKPMIIEQNHNRRISLRFYIEADPLVGYSKQDFSIAFTQLDSISIKEEECENPAILSCTMKAVSVSKMFSSLTGLQEKVERPFRDRKTLTRNFTFTLLPITPDSETYVRVEFGEPAKEYTFEFDMVKMLLLEDVHAVWNQLLREQARRRPNYSLSHTHKLVSEMDSLALALYLEDLKLNKGMLINGVQKAKIMLRGNGKRSTFHGGDELVIKKPKTVSSHIRKLLAEPPLSNLLKDREVSSKVYEKIHEFLEGQHTDPDCYPVVYTRELLQELSQQKQDELADIVRRVKEMNRFFDNTQSFQQYPMGFPPPPPPNPFAPAVHLDDYFQKDPMENYQQNVLGDLKNLEPMEGILMNDDEMAEFFQPGDFNFAAQGDFGQQLLQQKKLVQEASPTPESVSSGSNLSPTPARDLSYVSSDTQLFTFPPRDLVISGIDPVVLLVRDVRTLDRKEFVNDNVMSFMLNYIAVYMIDKALMKKIHVCNTFFYSNLTRQVPTLAFSGRRTIDPVNQQILVDNCARVLRWTKKFDVFSKDYIVVPINEDYHWLLITVFNPAGAIVDMRNEKESRAAPKCYVAFFDPLSGLEPAKGNHMTHCIKTYLEELYDKTKTAGKKFASEFETQFDPERVVITRPKNLPIQNNFYDCGLYALHFIEGLFCYLNRPVTVNDFPDFDWSTRYPAADDMADLMRDKIYNVVLTLASPLSRRRLSRYEQSQRTGLSQEGKLRRGRRHSANNTRRLPRHPEFRPRRYSVNPPARNVMDDPMFLNPRAMVEMPATRKVRSLRWPEENFPVIY